MSIEKSDEHLDELLEIIPPKSTPKTPPQTTIVDAVAEEVEEEIVAPVGQSDVEEQPKENTEVMEYKNEYEKNLILQKKNLQNVFEIAEGVLQSSSEQAREYGKSRDAEAVAVMVKSLTDLVKQQVDINDKLYPQEKEAPAVTTATQNNYIFKGDFRELIDVINGKSDK